MENSFSIFPEAGKIGLEVADHVSAMLAYWDKDQICRFANNAYTEWFGKSKEEMINKITMKELLGPLYEKNLPYINAALTGKKQVFEREIPISDGSCRHSLATYFPDIANGEVKGFFVHVADVTYVKELEAKLLLSKQEMLRSVIEAQENERLSIEHVLSENVSQMLVYSKMLISHQKGAGDKEMSEKILASLNSAIAALKEVTMNLTPAAIKHFGFLNGTEDYIETLQIKHPVEILFEYPDKKIEELDIKDKLYLFRIIQNFLRIVTANVMARMVCIRIHFTAPTVQLDLGHNDTTFSFPKDAKEFIEIQQRVEYYGGSLTETTTTDENLLQVQLTISQNNPAAALQ